MQDHAFVRLEAVHLDQQLVERLFALIVPAAEAGAAVPADGVDFVDEDDARRVGLALFEEVAHPRGADADEHLDEIGSRHREERPARLAGDRLGEQRLAGARRPDQQRTLGQPPAEPGELLRILQELDDLLQLDLGLVGTGNVGEGDLGGVAGEDLGLRLAEREGPVAARLELPEEEPPEQDHADPRQRPERQHGQTSFGLPGRDRDAVLLHPVDDRFGIGHRQQDAEALDGLLVDHDRRAEVAVDFLAIDDLDRGDVVGVQLRREVGVTELARRALTGEVPDAGQHDQRGQQPERDLLAEGLPADLRRARGRAVRHQFRSPMNGR